MLLTDYNLLAYLHDAECVEFTWISANPDQKLLRFVAQIHPDAGYLPWNGKKLIVILSNVVIARMKCLGYRLGTDSIDSWELCVSSDLEKECDALS